VQEASCVDDEGAFGDGDRALPPFLLPGGGLAFVAIVPAGGRMTLAVAMSPADGVSPAGPGERNRPSVAARDA
jgi:hypothetical protein